MAALLRSDFDINQLNKLVMESLQQSSQMKMKQFPHRTMFLKKITTEDLLRKLNELLYRMSELKQNVISVLPFKYIGFKGYKLWSAMENVVQQMKGK